MDKDKSFIDLYLEYTKETECPTFFHRWSAITSLGAWLSKNVHFKFGHFTLYPNQYCILVGAAGTRKSTAIKIATKLLTKAGYKTFSAQKTRQEKYLLDLAELQEEGVDILESNIFGDTASEEPANSFIAADEFGNFIGAGNVDFMSILGDLWDYEGVFKYRLKNSNSVTIQNPNVSILGGITAPEFNRVFPQEAIGQGFFSRLIIVHDEPTENKYTLPPDPCADTEAALIDKLHIIKKEIKGRMIIGDAAYKLLDTIYHTWKDIPDSRFEHYSNRRSPHLIKLAMIIAASECSMEISHQHLLYANTILTMTEHFMPKALGEFGKSKNSSVSHKVLQLLEGTYSPVSFKDMWRHVHVDLDRREQLVEIIQNLLMAEKLQQTDNGYLPIKRVLSSSEKETLDWGLLLPTEKHSLGA